MIVSVFVRRLREGCSFADFLREWEADVGFGVPTRVFNAVSLEDSREVISIGFVGVTPAELEEGLAAARDSEQVRHDRIDTVIESTTLRAMPTLRSVSAPPPVSRSRRARTSRAARVKVRATRARKKKSR